MKPRHLSLIVPLSGLLMIAVTHAHPSISLSEDKAATSVWTQLPAEKLRPLAQAITVKVGAGDSRGSGIIIAKDKQTYTVVSNAHVVNRGEPYRITTADGKNYFAQLKNKGDSFEGNDLALLQFQSVENYPVAQIADYTTLSHNEKVFAAGFPNETDQLVLTTGNISLIAEKPLVGGYQIGFTSQTQQGMSGGALLNEQGKVIGVLGQGNVAILEHVYTYQDGSLPKESDLGQMRESSFAIPIAEVVQMMPKQAVFKRDNTYQSYRF
jgi:S1-C subfamily serine protease